MSTIMLAEPDPAGDAAVALALERGAPALVTREVNDGRVALLTTTVDPDWGTLSTPSSPWWSGPCDGWARVGWPAPARQA